MHRLTKLIAAIGAVILSLVFVVGCSDDNPSAQQQESKAKQNGYSRLVAEQPAQTMNYSPTRATVNEWIKKWSQPGKLSYVYLLASNGQKIGYYIFKGLPVSYCASLTPTYGFEHRDVGQYDGEVMVPAPGVDGVYYSGGQCQAYYGLDASTGQYMEYTVGTGISALVFEQPMPDPNVKPLGFTTVDEAKKIK